MNPPPRIVSVWNKSLMLSRLPRYLPLVLLILLLVAPLPASAHGYLLRAIPEDGAVLERAPARLQYWFSEELESEFSTITVRDQTGNLVASGGVSAENSSLLTVRLPRGLPDGAYIADLRLAFASDGHVIAQSQVFFVGVAAGTVSSSGVRSQADPLEMAWRGLLLASTLTLFGVFTLYAGILLPAWGSSAHPAGLLPPRVMHRLSAVIGVAFGAAVVGSLLALLQQAMAFFNADIGQVLASGLWNVARVGTRFGDLWTARVLLLALTAGLFAASHAFRDEQPELVRPFWSAAVWPMTIVLGTFSVGSHAAGSLILPWVAVFNDWLHILAVGLWAGGLTALALVLPPALAPYEGDARRLALLAVLRRFSRWATAALLLVIASGVYSAALWIGKPSDISQTPFGGALLLKLILVAGLLLVGLVHHLALHPARYARWQAALRPLVTRVQAFVPSLRLEMLVAAMVILSVSQLSATPVPVPDFVRNSVPPPSATQTVGDLDILFTLTPGGPGVNTYDALITRAGQPVDGLGVKVQMVDPNRDRRSRWLTAEDSDSGLYVSAGAELDQAGAWWSLVDVTLPDGTQQRAAFRWDISEAASVIQAHPPGVVHLLALLGVLAALGWVLYPSARRGYDRLDLNPATVTVGLAAVAGTVFFTLVGFVFILNAQAQYEDSINPPPTVVNTVLPDADSIMRGMALYTQACAGWEGSALRDLIERLPRTRDDQLLAATRDGWMGLPACLPIPDELARWNLVNAIRTFEAAAPPAG